MAKGKRDQVEIDYVRDEEKIALKIKFGDATIKVKSTSDEGGDDLGLLVQNLPTILTRVFEQMQAAEEAAGE